MKKAIYAILLCALIAGNNGILIKYLSTMSTGTIAFFRSMVPVVILSPVLFSKTKPFFTGKYGKMLLVSSINVVRIYLYLVAFIYTSIGNAVVLIYSWPIFVFGIEVFFMGKRLKKSQGALLLIAFLGMIITYSNKSFSFGNEDLIGMVAALFSALAYAITVILIKGESGNYTQEQLIVYQNLISALFFTPFIFFLPEIHWNQIGVGIFYGFLIGIVVFKLFFYGLKYLEASTASSLMYLEVVSAIVLAYLLLQETVTANTIVGGALIMTSSYFITRSNTKKV